MTVMIHKLVRLTGNAPEEIMRLSFMRDWSSAPGAISQTRERRTLDWASWMYEVSKAEVLQLIRPRPQEPSLRDEWDAQNARLLALDEHASYGVIWTEC